MLVVSSSANFLTSSHRSVLDSYISCISHSNVFHFTSRIRVDLPILRGMSLGPITINKPFFLWEKLPFTVGVLLLYTYRFMEILLKVDLPFYVHVFLQHLPVHSNILANSFSNLVSQLFPRRYIIAFYRYIICEELTEEGATKVKDYLTAVNNKLDELEKSKTTNKDVNEVVPANLIHSDDLFMDYLVTHNERCFLRHFVLLRSFIEAIPNRLHRLITDPY